MQLPVAILAGGLATRLQPLTATTPKSLVLVGGEPFIAHQVRMLQRKGVRRIVLCTGHLGERIEGFVGDGARFGVHVDYSSDGDRLLGTGGALRKAAPLLGEAFLVLYGDSYLDCDYAAVEESFLRSGKAALMTVFRNQGQWDASNVLFEDGRIVRYSKVDRSPAMAHIDYGLGAIQTGALESMVPADAAYDLTECYRDLLARRELAAYEVPERFYEIGSFEGIRELEQRLSAKGEVRMGFVAEFLDEVKDIVDRLDQPAIEHAVEILAGVKASGGRLFILGVGGSAANASHAVNDFRKLAGIEAYAPTDNISELTARANDEGWSTIFAGWLKVSRLRSKDALLVLSVGGGDMENNVSPNLVTALEYAKEVGAKVVGIVGRNGGYTARVADACVLIPTVNARHVTPHAEAFQGVVWHLLVSHPALKQMATKWETIAALPHCYPEGNAAT
jgi:D-sedoheptulose 7-phosphate isomerase